MDDICKRTMARRCATQQCDSERAELVQEIKRLREENLRFAIAAHNVVFGLETEIENGKNEETPALPE